MSHPNLPDACFPLAGKPTIVQCWMPPAAWLAGADRHDWSYFPPGRASGLAAAAALARPAQTDSALDRAQA